MGHFAQLPVQFNSFLRSTINRFPQATIIRILRPVSCAANLQYLGTRSVGPDDFKQSWRQQSCALHYYSPTAVVCCTAVVASLFFMGNANAPAKVCRCASKMENESSLDHVEVDLLIVGAGSAGLTAAKFASKGPGGLGHRVALAESRELGGDCTWYGCVPSKALIHKAKLSDHAHGQGATEFAETLTRDAAEHIGRVQSKIFLEEDQKVFEERDVVVLKGEITLTSGTSARCKMHDGSVRTVSAQHILICTGAVPSIPAGLEKMLKDADVPYWTYESLWPALKNKDDVAARTGKNKIAVIGGGPIGCELSQALARLGWEVSLVASKLLPRDDDQVREVISRAFADQPNLTVIPGRPVSIRRDDDHIVVDAGSAGTAVVDKVLVCTGRKPNIAALGLEEVGVRINKESGGIEVGSDLKTSVPSIYACGDCLGGPQFTHYAGWQAVYAVRNAFFPGSSNGLPKINPWVTFTDPEVAQVGMTESEARAKFGNDVRVETMNFDNIDRLQTDCDDKYGQFVTLIFKNQTIIGGTIVCARAGEMISEIGLAVKQKLTASEIADFIHPYPSYSFAIFQICGKVATDHMLGNSAIKFFNWWIKK